MQHRNYQWLFRLPKKVPNTTTTTPNPSTLLEGELAPSLWSPLLISMPLSLCSLSLSLSLSHICSRVVVTGIWRAACQSCQFNLLADLHVHFLVRFVSVSFIFCFLRRFFLRLWGVSIKLTVFLAARGRGCHIGYPCRTSSVSAIRVCNGSSFHWVSWETTSERGL